MFGKDKKKRSRRVNTKYGQKTLKHAKKGIQSCMMAVLCAVILIVMILVSFLMKGNCKYNRRISLFCTACTGSLWIQARYLRGLNERDKKYITCKVGIGVNGLVLAGVAAIFIRGVV